MIMLLERLSSLSFWLLGEATAKKMKPAWDRLIKDFKDSKTALVADVDCTAAGKPLCDSNGVKGFPTIKYGDPNNLEKYEGGRDYDSLKKFAEEELEAIVNGTKDAKAAAEKNFKDEVSKLQKKY